MEPILETDFDTQSFDFDALRASLAEDVLEDGTLPNSLMLDGGISVSIPLAGLNLDEAVELMTTLQTELNNALTKARQSPLAEKAATNFSNSSARNYVNEVKELLRSIGIEDELHDNEEND